MPWHLGIGASAALGCMNIRAWSAPALLAHAADSVRRITRSAVGARRRRHRPALFHYRLYERAQHFGTLLVVQICIGGEQPFCRQIFGEFQGLFEVDTQVGGCRLLGADERAAYVSGKRRGRSAGGGGGEGSGC